MLLALQTAILIYSASDRVWAVYLASCTWSGGIVSVYLHREVKERQ